MTSDSLEAGKSPIAGRLLQRLVQFSALLRNSGLVVTTAETLDAITCVLLIDLTSRVQFYHAMKAAFVKRPEDSATFDNLFERFWRKAGQAWTGQPMPQAGEPKSFKGRAGADLDSSGSSIESLRKMAVEQSDSPSEERDGGKQSLALYSPHETLGKKTFSNFDVDSNSRIRRTLKRFARRVATRPGRRLISSEAGAVDLRRTFRSGLGTGGHFVELERRRRKISKSRIVVLCDVSGSMDSHSNQLLELLYHFCNASRGTEVFAFSTRLVKLNRYLEGRSLLSASQLVSEAVNFWSSGTRIGAALETLLRRHTGSLRSSTVLVIVSDGWELGDLDILAADLQLIRRRVAKIIWLNPLADNPDYRPLAAGMRTALPYIDIFAGLRIFKDRREFDRVFGKSTAPLAHEERPRVGRQHNTAALPWV